VRLRIGPTGIFSRKYSAIGVLRPGPPQDWQHRIMPKGFVFERDLNPRARYLRVCVAG